MFLLKRIFWDQAFTLSMLRILLNLLHLSFQKLSLILLALKMTIYINDFW